MTLIFGLGMLMNNSFASYTKSYETFCFQKHINESLSINKARRKVYAQLTAGRSDRIFNKLISYEYITLAPATFFDLKALKYQKQGMDLFCHEFMSMIRTPSFDPNHRKIPQEIFRPFNLEFYKGRMTEALKHGDSVEVKKATIEALIELKSQPNYYCFTRHFIESIYRFAYFAPMRKAQAEELGLKDPSEMIFNVMKLHTLGLKECHGIDLWSQPIQMSGIPILCTEIPDLLFDLQDPELDVLKHK